MYEVGQKVALITSPNGRRITGTVTAVEEHPTDNPDMRSYTVTLEQFPNDFMTECQLEDRNTMSANTDSRSLDQIEWPAAPLNLNERRAVFVYEVARMQAAAVDAPIVPEPWSQRELAFKEQFLDVIAMMCGPDRKSDPEELHNDWWRKYEEMGWNRTTTSSAPTEH